MGFFDDLFDFLRDGDSNTKIIDDKIYIKCANCGTWVAIDAKRCPKCKKRLTEMFKKKCPKCGTINDLRAEKCKKCRYDFALEEAKIKLLKEEIEKESQQYYVCPICGYRSKTFLTQCPACGTRFI